MNEALWAMKPGITLVVEHRVMFAPMLAKAEQALKHPGWVSRSFDVVPVQTPVLNRSKSIQVSRSLVQRKMITEMSADPSHPYLLPTFDVLSSLGLMGRRSCRLRHSP